MEPPLRNGKLPPTLLAELLGAGAPLPPEIRLGPRPGEDACAIDVESGTLVVATDPITMTEASVGAHAVVINANDVAVMGVRPRWFLAAVLFPEHTRATQVRALFSDMQRALQVAGVTLVGGHTEITPAVGQTVVVGQMLGMAERGRVIATGGMQPGDVLFQVGEAPVEGAAVLSREASARIQGVSPALRAAAAASATSPGLSVVDAALLAAELGATSLHDPTEGGLATGLHELSTTSELCVELCEAAVLWFEPGIELLQTRNGEKVLPGSGQRIYVADWNNDGIKDLIIGASVATVNDGEFSDELSWEWENVTGISSAGKDPGLQPPRPRPTLASLKSNMKKIREQAIANGGDMSSWKLWTDEELLHALQAQQELWDKEIGRLYDEGKAHWLTLRHQGRVYVMLGTNTYTGKASPTAVGAKVEGPKQRDAASPGADSYPVQVSLSLADSFATGAKGEVAVNFSMSEGWYIYAPTGRNALNGMVETNVEFEFPDVFRADGAVHYPAYRYKDVYDVYMENTALSQAVVTASGAKPGTYEVSARVTFQVCKEDLCLPPRTESLTAAIDLK